MPTYSANGVKLHYEEAGKGTPLILVHGFAQDLSSWIDVIPTYARHFHVCAVDLRGCGRSDVPEPGYGPKDLVQDMIALMDHLGARKVHFSGFSLGGAIGQELAIAHPDRLKSLSLHSTWEGGPCAHMQRWIDVRTRAIASGDPVLNWGTRVVSFFSPEFANAHPERVEEFIQRSSANPYPLTPKGAQGHGRAVMLHDTRGRLGAIKTPTLITVGSMDRATLPSQSRYLHENIKGSELVFIDGGGHFTPYQCPDEFISISLGFLMKHEA